MEHKIKFYPVGNADCTLVKLSNGKTIVIAVPLKKRNNEYLFCKIMAFLCVNSKIWYGRYIS